LAWLSYPLSAWILPGRVRRRPNGVRTAGMSSTTACSMVTSATLAAVTTTVSGSRCRRRPGGACCRACHDRRDLRPRGPPTPGPHAHAVHARPRPVHLAPLAEPVQDHKMQLVEHPRSGPLGEPTPTGRGRATAKLAGRQQSPGGRRAGHEHDGGKAGPVGDGAVPAAVGRPRRRRQQGRHQRPQLVRHQLISKGRHGMGSFQTDPKGAKRCLIGSLLRWDRLPRSCP
jgi:hypothetical protein